VSWTDLAIAPLGALYFGDGRPMTAGETDYGDGRFPPSPRTMQGLVRSALLYGVPDLDLETGADRDRIANLVGPPDRLPDGWQIVGPWLASWTAGDDGQADRVEPWMPRPQYLVERSGCARNALQALKPKPLETDNIKWDLDSGPEMAALSEGRVRTEPTFMDPETLRAVLAGSVPAGSTSGLPEFVKPEPRTGLVIEPGKSVARAGMLYTLGFHRFADQAGFVLRFRGDLSGGLTETALTNGVATLGGKNRLARLLAVSGWSKDFEAALRGDHLPNEPADKTRFWVWTTTPVALERPWAPGLNPDRIGAAEATVVTAAIGPPERIGGFSLADRRSAAVQSHVPAGSAWLVEIKGGSAQDRGTLLSALHNAFPLGTDPGARSMGFGHTLVSCRPH